MTVSDSLAYAEDFTNAVDCIISENTKPVYVVIVQNDQIAFNDTNTNRFVQKIRITIADGYRSYLAQDDSPFDGYLNPRVQQLTPSQVKFLGNGQLSSDTYLIGGICFPYTYAGNSYGLDPLLVFQPPIVSYSNLQVYLQIFGLGFANTTNYFAVKQIMLSSGKRFARIQEGISYKVLVEKVNINIPS